MEKYELNHAQEAHQRINVDLDVSMKIDHEVIAGDLIAPLLSGYCDPLTMMSKIAHLQKVCDIATEKIKDLAINERLKFEKSPTINGVEFGYMSGKSNYDFSNSQIIVDAENRLKSLKEIAKALTKNKQPMAIDAENGEVISPAIVKYSKDSLTIKIK
ncbi:MAG: hypothetical protein KBG30_14535 [Bacteroidales bacterium]|nr:hypothetical protein [Bacteroidales bacterium]